METHINTDIPSGSSLLSIDEEMLEASVIERLNRFIIIADLNGQRVKCHLHDPGRLKELIYPGNRILLREKQGQKTKYSVVCAYESEEWVLIDSRYHPQLARKFLPADARAEVTVGRKRIDFQAGNEFIEVKGCSLVEDSTAKFPDAPSIRASEHVNLLAELMKKGHDCTVMFLVMRKNANCFVPNDSTDPEFSENLLNASRSGLRLVFLKMHMEGNQMVFDGTIDLCNQIEKTAFKK